MFEYAETSAVPVGDVAWAALCADPNTGVAILNRDGVFTYANDQIVTLMFGTHERAVDTLTGRSIHDALPPEVAADRWRAIARVFETGRPILFRSICKGYQNHSWMHPMRIPDNPVGSNVLVVTRRASDDAAVESPVEYDYDCASVNDLGPMEVLSSRELEVLALLGAGQSIRSVATSLSRSTKTIEKHRDSISRKLNISTRADLVRLVQQAGLTRADATRRGR